MYILSQNRILVYLLMLIIMPILCLSFECNVLFVAVLFVWCLMFDYAYSDIERKSLLFAFLALFFLFLIGRDFLEQLFLYKVEIFDEETNNHAYISMLLSLVSIFASYRLFFNDRTYDYNINSDNAKFLRAISKKVFYITLAFSMIANVFIVRYVLTHGYADSFVGLKLHLDSNIALFVISKIALATPVALSIFFATLPSKKDLKTPVILYIIHLALTIGQGNRGTMMLGLFFLMIYFIFRQNLSKEEVWFKKIWLKYFLCIVPGLAILFAWYNLWRFDELSNNFEWYTGIFEFFYAQGVTSNIIKHGYTFFSDLDNQTLYVLEFAKSGTIGRLLGLDVYQGNSIDHALYGGSYTHALAYKVLGEMYLNGRGTGTSYIAELYQDFLYPGVIIGNIIYAYLLANITNFHKNKSVFIMSIQFLMIPPLLWAPRGSFSGFISVMLYPSTIATYIIIFGLNYINILIRRERIKL